MAYGNVKFKRHFEIYILELVMIKFFLIVNFLKIND